MKFTAALSTQADTVDALREVLADIGDIKPDLAALFVTHHHGSDFEAVVEAVTSALGATHLIGCTGESIIGPDREVEGQPAMALWTAQLPGVEVHSFHVTQHDVESSLPQSRWHCLLGVVPEEEPVFIILPDPFSIDADRFLHLMDRAYPGAVLVGGMASGAVAPGQNRLFLAGQVLQHGMVGVALTGRLSLSTVVSQGCRPIGKPYVVTRAQQNLIEELAGRPVLEVLQEVYHSADEEDQSLMQHGIHLGYVVDETLSCFSTGDFLIRNILGVVEDRALAITDVIRPGQTVQFHVRDRRTADEEMRTLLARRITETGCLPSGGLMFSCNGRGTRLFEEPDHDIAIVNALAQNCPVAGFFAQGEIGPVGRKTFIHGFTSSLILFHG